MHNAEFDLSEQAQRRSDLLNEAIAKKFNKYLDYVTITSDFHESLNLGFIYIDREMLPDGRRSGPEVIYDRAKTMYTYSPFLPHAVISKCEKIRLEDDGQWKYGENTEPGAYHGPGERVSSIRKGIVLARLIIGHPRRIKLPGLD